MTEGFFWVSAGLVALVLTALFSMRGPPPTGTA